MTYLVEDAKDGAFIAKVKSYEQALTLQHNKFKEGIDTYIRKVQ